MAKKKKKQQGHYCRICGDYKANEKFSGKGHAQHICKSCMSAMRSGKNPEDILPEPLPVSRETTRFKKLDKEGKAVLKAFISEVVTEYWQENRQIPFAESFSELKKYIIGTYDEECGILLKDDAELKTYDNDHKQTAERRESEKRRVKITGGTRYQTCPARFCRLPVISAATDVSDFRHPRYAPARLSRSVSPPP